MRIRLAALIVPCVVTVLSTILGYMLAQEPASWVAIPIVTALIGILLRFSVQDQIFATFSSLVLIAYIVAEQPWGIGVAAVTGLLGMILGTSGLSDLFTSTGITPFEYAIRNLSGQLNPPDFVQPPQKGVRVPDEWRFGPRWVTVQPEAAAIMVQGSRQTRVAGPGRYLSLPFEYVERVYNLRPIHKTFRFSDVLTKNRLPTVVEVSVTYGILVGLEGRLGIRPLTEQERTNIRNVASWAPDWEDALRSVVEKYTRISIGHRTIAQALNVVRVTPFEQEITIDTRNEVQTWGIDILALDLVSIQPNEDLVIASSDNWLAQTRNDTLIQRENARGAAWAQALNSIASAYQEAKWYDLPDRIVYQEILRRLFEQASLDPEVRNLLQAELGRLLARSDREETE